MSAPHDARTDDRDAALGRVRRAFRWSVVVSLAVLGAIVGTVAHELPGRAGTSGAPASGPTTGTGAGSGSPQTSAPGPSGPSAASPPSTAAPAPPTTAPVPTWRHPVAVSGGTSW